MLRLTLLRHGESVSNCERRFAGWRDVELSVDGRRQAEHAARWLRDAGLEFDVAFTSCLRRATETLRIVLQAMGLDGVPVQQSWRLNERHYGALQGLTWWQACMRYGPHRVVGWQRRFTTTPPPLATGAGQADGAPSAESLGDMRARLLPYWRETIAPAVHSGQRVLIVAHRNPLCALLGLVEQPETDAFSRPRIPTAQPLVYELDAQLRPLRRYYLPIGRLPALSPGNQSMSILGRYVMKEILSPLIGVAAVVVSIFCVQRFAALLGDASGGSLPLTVILHLLALRTVMALPTLLPVAVYVAVLLGLGRLYQDHEMTALAACGVPRRRVHAAVMAFAALAALAIGVASFSLRPWAAGAFEVTKERAASQAGLGQVGPGQFHSLPGNSELVVFAESRSRDDPRFVENVFVQLRENGSISVLFAARAAEHVDARLGHRFLRLLDGRRYDLGHRGEHYEITRYEESVIRTPIAIDPADEGSTDTRSLRALVSSSDRGDAAELQWRLAAPVSVLLLVFLAIRLSRINAQQGRYARLVVAILLYLGYRHLLGLARGWIASGALAPFPGTWSVHALFLAAALLLAATERRDDTGGWRWSRLLRRSRAPGPQLDGSHARCP